MTLCRYIFLHWHFYSTLKCNVLGERQPENTEETVHNAGHC